VNRQFLIREEAINWIETVVKPYRAEWEVREQTFTDPRDGKVYRTVKIGSQIWMAENLNYDIPGSKCYKNDPANAEKYDRVYNWKTAKKACPEGWHLPSNDEWQTLVDFVGGKEIAGKKLKATSGWKKGWFSSSGNGEDTYGFSALPSGSPCFVGQSGAWWTSSNINFFAYQWIMGNDYKGVLGYYQFKFCRCSVRCVKD